MRRTFVLIAVATLSQGCGKNNTQACEEIGKLLSNCILGAPSFSTSACAAKLDTAPTACQNAAHSLADCIGSKSCDAIGNTCGDAATSFDNNCAAIANVSTNPNSVREGSEPATGSTTGSSAVTQEPLTPGTYNVVGTLDNSHTTCASGACGASVSTTYDITYASGVYHIVNSGGGVADVQVTNGNEVTWSLAPTTFTTQAGCPAQGTGAIALTLSSTSFVGAYQESVNAQACNGYAATSCTCAYDLQSQ